MLRKMINKHRQIKIKLNNSDPYNPHQYHCLTIDKISWKKKNSSGKVEKKIILTMIRFCFSESVEALIE